MPPNKRCFLLYHDSNFFGLSRFDTALPNKKMGDWVTQTCTVIDKNRKFVKNVIKKIEAEERNSRND